MDGDKSFQSTLLGSTGLRVGRMGVAASYGVPARAVEQAFEQGVNYLYFGSRRTGAFAEAIRNLRPQRERLVLVIQSYSRIAALVGPSLERALREVRLDCADILLLGLWNKPVAERILEAARKVKERGLVRFLALSSHDRPLLRTAGGGARVRRFPFPLQRHPHRRRARHFYARSESRSRRHGRLHGHQLETVDEPEEDSAGRQSSDRGRLLSIRALAPRSGCLHDRAFQRSADDGGVRHTQPGPHVGG